MKKLYSLGMLFFYMTVSMFAQVTDFSEQDRTVWNKQDARSKEIIGFLSEDAYSYLESRYNIKTFLIDKIKSYCHAKEAKKYIQNYLLSGQERVIAKEQIDNIYQDSIDILLIPYNHEISGAIISFALMAERDLNITQRTHNELVENALFLARERRKDPCRSIAREEMDRLKGTLNKRQLDKLIDMKNSSEARRRAERAWDILSHAGMLEQQDSISQIGRAFLYYCRQLYINDYFVDEPELIENNMTDLYRTRPTIIKMYDSLYQNEVIKKKHEGKVGIEYSW